MSTQQTVPNQDGAQTILVTDDYDASVSDRSLCVQTEDVLVTLPDNPTVGETMIALLAQASFQLSGGENPFPSDPITLGAGQSVIASFTANGWELLDGGGGWVTGLDTLYSALPAQTLAGAGPFNLGGFLYTKFFPFGGGEIAPPQIVPGQGLIINGFAPELLMVDLLDILPRPAAQKWSTWIRMWMLIQNADFSLTGATAFLMAASPADGIDSFIAAGGRQIFVADDVNNGNSRNESVFFLNAGDGNTVVLSEIPGLNAFGTRALGGLVNGDSFPLDSDSTFMPGGPFLSPLVSLGPPEPRISFFAPGPFLANFKVGPGMVTGGTTPGTIVRFRVDYKL